jgi:uncharacterized membrane protein
MTILPGIRLLFELIGCKMIKIQTQIISEELMENQPTTDVTSDDKLWSLLAYILTPIVPIIIMLMEDKKNRPFIRAHNAQALVLGIVLWIINVVLTPVGIGCITSIITLIVVIYLGIQAYNGKYNNIPVITDFVKNQGWA